jgi:RNA 2',3'-cyclic 3'-phosphodiesterase
VSSGGRDRGPSFFVAFPFPYRGALAGLAPAPPRVRQFAPEDLHITLAYFGASGIERARAGFAAIDASRMKPLEVTLGRARLLGNPRFPTAIARAVADGADAIAEHIDAFRGSALEAAGLPPDHRAPLPHLTIARVHRRAAPAERAQAEAWTAAVEPGVERFALNRVALFTWREPREAGSHEAPLEEPSRRYRVLDARRLGAE